LPAPDDGTMNVGLIARKYFTKSTNEEQWDKTFGLKGDHTGNLKFDDAEFKTDGNEMIIYGKRFKGTEGLWELVTLKIPDKKVYTVDDEEKYKEIMVSINAMRNPEIPNRPAGNYSGYKWDNHIQPMWYKYVKKNRGKCKEKANRQQKKKQGQGFLLSDPNALCERLELLMASKQAGNTGFRNKIVSIKMNF